VVSFPDECALRDLCLADVRPTVSPASLRVDLRVSYGIPYWVLVLGFVVLLALVAVVLEVRSRKVREAEATARMREERKRLTGYHAGNCPGAVHSGLGPRQDRSREVR